MYNTAQSRDDEAGGDPTDRRYHSVIGDRQLIVVSNRQPYRHDVAEDGDGISISCPTGGLTAGLDPVIQETGGTWIAWGDGDADPEVVDEDNRVLVPPEDPQYAVKRVWLSEAEVRGYYDGFSNQVLWPLCHSALATVRGEPSFWRRYRRVNDRFADAVVQATSDRSLVWFQDYHLALTPRIAQAELPRETELIHFWHVPWPSWDVFRACPHARELLRGLLGNDAIGFHTDRYRANFLRCVDAAIDDVSVRWEASEVYSGDHVTSVDAIPMGVQCDEIERLAATPSAETFWPSFRRDHDVPPRSRIALGVDRLDYTKGIPARLRALERLWETHPKWRGALTYIQNASESRSRVPAYQSEQCRVDEAVDRINDRFGTDEWQPVISFTDRLTPAELYGLYRRADLALVSPIRDGMNLVAQEYTAAQVDETGALVLSEQTGVHDRLGSHAYTVSPFDPEEFAETIVEALTASPKERRRRMKHLRRIIAENDLDAWLRGNLQSPKRRHERDRRLAADFQ